MDILSNNQNFKCSKHQKNNITLIQVNQLEDNKHIFYCELCMMYDKKYQSSNYVLSKQIIEQEKNSHIINWPLIDDESLQDQIYKIQTEDKQQNQLECQINQYFDLLKTEIYTNIESCQKNMVRKAQEFSQFEDEIFKKISECQMVEQFKSILLNKNAEVNVKEKQCREFINQVHQQKSSYASQLKQMFDNLIQKQQSIDFKTPDLIKQSIIQFIQNINFFNLQNNFKNQQVNINQEDIQNSLNEQKVDKLIELLSVKSNFLCDNFIGSIKKLLKQISPQIDQISFNQIHSSNNKPIDFSKLSDKQMKAIKDLTEYYAEQQLNQNLSEEVKQSKQFKQISQILKNKTNNLEESFIVELEKYIVETYPLLQCINFNNSLKNNQQIEVFKVIKDENELNKCEFIENKTQLQSNNLQLFSKIQFIKSHYAYLKSEYVQGKKLENNSIQIISRLNMKSHFYSNIILNRYEKYIFRFQFKLDMNQYAGFSIGLVRDETKDQNFPFYDHLSYFNMQGKNKYGQFNCGWGIEKCVKGDSTDVKEINIIELRVCISDGVLEVVDYPNYHHKYAISDQSKIKLMTYQNLKLGIYLENTVELTLINAQRVKSLKIE